MGALLAGAFPLLAQEYEGKPADPYFAKFEPLKAQAPAGLVLRPGDRLAICGDSITEQKLYSRVMETYLAACAPELRVAVRQYGWGGETSWGFLARMTNDCLRFKPTVATTCYGMNDHGYRPYEASIGARYRTYSAAIVEAFKANGTRVILGSPGCVGVKSQPGWDEAGVEAKNLNLCMLRNIDVAIAREAGTGFADVFWPMLKAGFTARQQYSPDYAIAGKDGVHPGWSGSFVMAYAFLRAMGLDGEIGRFSVDLASGQAQVSAGHQLLSSRDGNLEIRSSRYPFCAKGDVKSDNSIRSAMTLVPFHVELNRLILVARNGQAARYKVTWGPTSKTYTAAELAKGVNLAQDFVENPFTPAFEKLDAAVAAKQAYETRQIKDLFHGPEARVDMEAVVRLTEAVRAEFDRQVQAAFTPVTHTLQIASE